MNVFEQHVSWLLAKWFKHNPFSISALHSSVFTLSYTANFGGKLSTFLSLSSVDMIAEMNRVNQNQEDDYLIIGSTDVVALYPSLDIEFTIDKVCEVFFESNVCVRGTDD